MSFGVPGLCMAGRDELDEKQGVVVKTTRPQPHRGCV